MPKLPPRQFFRIVVAADDTLASHNAVAFAIDLSKRIQNSVLQVIHAVGLNPPGTSLLGSLDRTSNLEIQKDGQATERSLRQILPEGTEFILKEAYEPVQNIISEFINENPPDMVVIGSSNRTGLERLVLGSVSDHCLHHCHCPVTRIVLDIQQQAKTQ